MSRVAAVRGRRGSLLYPLLYSRQTRPFLSLTPTGAKIAVQLLVLRGLSPHEPAIPVPYALAQCGLSNTELSAAGSISLRVLVVLTASLLCLPEVVLRC